MDVALVTKRRQAGVQTSLAKFRLKRVSWLRIWTIDFWRSSFRNLVQISRMNFRRIHTCDMAWFAKHFRAGQAWVLPPKHHDKLCCQTLNPTPDTLNPQAFNWYENGWWPVQKRVYRPVPGTDTGVPDTPSLPLSINPNTPPLNHRPSTLNPTP